MSTGRLCSYESSLTGKTIKDFDYSQSIDRMNRIMDFYHLSELLQPRHDYFADKQAYISDFIGYKEPEHVKKLLYARLAGKDGGPMPRHNPYRKHQLAGTNTARVIKMLKGIVEGMRLDDFKLAFLTITMPGELSVWLSEQDNGKDIAWRMYQKFWAWYDCRFGPGLAGHVNLHPWSTDNPLKPHYHFHTLIPNYKKTEIDIEDDNGEKACELVKQDWHEDKNGKVMPLPDGELLEVKEAWYKIIVKVCKKHGIDWVGVKEPEWSTKINIHIRYATWKTIIGRCQLMHWFNYQGRYPLEDYAKFSNVNLDCDNPPEWLENYSNRARKFGWWCDMRSLMPNKKEDKIKINPVTGGNMDYMGHWTFYELLDDGKLGFLEVIRGSPVYHQLNGRELNWLVSVQSDLHPGAGRDMMYSQTGEEEGET